MSENTLGVLETAPAGEACVLPGHISSSKELIPPLTCPCEEHSEAPCSEENLNGHVSLNGGSHGVDTARERVAEAACPLASTGNPEHIRLERQGILCDGSSKATFPHFCI